VLKHKLTHAPVLSFPDFTRPFILDTDASNSGIGAVLSQIINGQETVIAYASRTLSKAERKYYVTRKELLAMVYFINHFRSYLLGRKFTLRRDHSSLTWLQTLKEPEGQLARWLEQLQEYHMDVVHRAGTKHANADAMSRRPPCAQCQRHGCSIQDQQENALICSNNHTNSGEVKVAAATREVHNVLEDSGVQPEETVSIREAQLQDGIIGPILTSKEENKQPDEAELTGGSHEARQLYQQWDHLLVREGKLFRKVEEQREDKTYLQLVVPMSIRDTILKEVHAGSVSGHLGGTKTFKCLKERFYWPGYSHDAREWCRICPNCAMRKSPTQHRRGPLQNIKSGYPMQIVAMDIVGPFPPSKKGNRYILVVSDYFTRWVKAYGIQTRKQLQWQRLS